MKKVNLAHDLEVNMLYVDILVVKKDVSDVNSVRQSVPLKQLLLKPSQEKMELEERLDTILIWSNVYIATFARNRVQ